MALEELDQQSKSQGELDQQSQVQGKKVKEKYVGVKTTLYRDPNTQHLHSVPVQCSPNPTIDRILRYVERTGFVSILNIGLSGSGKSTWSQQLIHLLHQKKTFTIHWFEKDDIKKLDTIIQNLQKSIDHLIIFDDASYAIDSLSKEKVNEIAKELTYIRHTLKGKIIIILNIHYSKAISKFFRNVPFVFLTSITNSEMQSFLDVFPHAKFKLRDFSWYYHNEMMNGGWSFETDKWGGKKMDFATDHPFRLALALEGNMAHFLLYLKTSCAICDPRFNKKKAITTESFIDYMVKAYGLHKARSMLRMYAFTKHGKRTMDSRRLSCWNTISEFDKNNSISWDNCMNVLDSISKNKRKRPTNYKDVSEHMKNLEALATEQPEEVKPVIENLSQEQRELETDYQEALQRSNEELKQKLAEKRKEKYSTEETETEYNESPDQNEMNYGFPDNDPLVEDYTKDQV